MQIIGNNIVEISNEEKTAISSVFSLVISSIKTDIENS